METEIRKLTGMEEDYGKTRGEDNHLQTKE